MKFAILGANGQLARDLAPRLPGEVHPLTRLQANLTQADSLRQTLTALRPDVVVNCAAYNFVDKAESEPEAAFAVNAWGVRNLALLCRDLDSVLVHFSTDYVFGLEEKRTTPYAVTAAPGPVSVYGLSKLAGEYLVRSICPKHFVIRTCGLYGLWGSGGKGTNFVETMLRLAGQGKPLRVVADQICTPSFTQDIATATATLIQTGRFGLHHLTNAGSCSWHDFAAEIFRLAKVSANLSPTTSKEYNAPARRPGYSVLENQAPLRLWTEALTDYLSLRPAK